MEKKILYLDMDGVVADFESLITEMLPDLHTNLAEYPTEQHKHDMLEKMVAGYEGCFYNLPLIPGAKEAVEKLFTMYDVYFLSTPMWIAPHSFTGKRLWIEKHFGEAAKKRLILTHRKDLAIGDILVDDRLAHGAGDFRGLHIHFGQGGFSNWENVLLALTLINKDRLTLDEAKAAMNVGLNCLY